MSAEFPTSQQMAQQRGALPPAGHETRQETRQERRQETGQEAGQGAGQETAVMSPAQRLAQSRERLREYMIRGDSRQRARRRSAAAHAAGESAALLDRLRAVPIIGPVMEVLVAWWEAHPLRSAASLAAEVAEQSVAPLARKHPFTLVAAAFGIGVAIAWFKPWKRIRTSVVLAGFASQVLSRAITQIPWDSMLEMFTRFAQTPAAPPVPDDVARDASPRDSVAEPPSAADSTFKRETSGASELAQASS